MGIRVRPDHPVQLVRKALPAHRVLREFRVRKELPVQQEFRDYKVFKAQPELE